jgi:hypothetical protein
MRKFYLLLAVFAVSLTSMAANKGIKNLYKQDFEAVKTAAEAGWTSPNLADGMTVVSTEFGKWFEFAVGNNNNRNAVLTWGTDMYGESVSKYSVHFMWGHVNPKGTNNGDPIANTQFSNELALIVPHDWQPNDAQKEAGIKAVNSINNGQYGAADSLRLFAITQMKGAYSDTNPYWESNSDFTNYAYDFMINNDPNMVFTAAENAWYNIHVTVDVQARTVTFSINDESDREVLLDGVLDIAANASPYISALNVLCGRYSSKVSIDDVKVQVETEGDYANEPTIALTGVNMNERTYKIFFEAANDEILHVKGTDGKEDMAVESPYEYVTTTTGVLEAWTEAGTALSQHVTENVDCSVISLPMASVAIKKVNQGYYKELTMSVSNADVPTQPNITLTYEFKGDQGEIVTSGDNEVPSGTTIEVTQKGTLTVVTHAYGFAETRYVYQNDSEFGVDASVDFQHMDEAKLLSLGFTEIDPLDSDKTSGENNWTARKRMWYQIKTGEVDAEGNDITETHVVYGPTASGSEAIRRFIIQPSQLNAENSHSMFAPVYTWYSEAGDGSDVGALKMNYGIGLINQGCKGDGGTSINYPNAPVGVDGLTDNDFFIVYVISDYGSSSVHPVFEAGTTVEEATANYKAMNLGDGTNVQVLKGTETFSLYRIDTAIARIDVFKAIANEGIIEVGNAIVSDHNAPIYNLNGMVVNPNSLQKGIYIKQGKKFIVR